MSKIENFIKNNLITEEIFSINRKLILAEINKNEKSNLEFYFSVFIHIFNNYSKYTPITLLNTLRLIKESMDIKNVKIITEIQTKILPFLVDLAKFKKEIKDDNRGYYFFSKNPSDQEKLIGNSFLRLLLECIMYWAKWFPLDLNNKETKFSISYNNLLSLGVKFPDQINYFKPKAKKNKNIQQKFSIILEAIETQKDFLLNLLGIEFEKELDNESIGQLIKEFKGFIDNSPKLMEEILNFSNSEEGLLGKIIAEQELLQKIINLYEKFNRKDIFFINFKQQIYSLLSKTPIPIPDSAKSLKKPVFEQSDQSKILKNEIKHEKSIEKEKNNQDLLEKNVILQERNDLIKEKNEILKERNNIIKEKNEILIEKDKEIDFLKEENSQLINEIKEKNNKIQIFQKLFEEKEEIIENLLNDKQELNKILHEKKLEEENIKNNLQEKKEILKILQEKESIISNLKSEILEKDEKIKEISKKSNEIILNLRQNQENELKPRLYGLLYEEKQLKKSQNLENYTYKENQNLIKLSDYKEKLKIENSGLKSLIFPFENANQYEENSKKKPFPNANYEEIKGFIEILDGFKGQSLINLKKCCINNKGTLFKSEILEINTICSLVDLDKKEFLRISFQIINKGEFLLEDLLLDIRFDKDLAIFAKEDLNYIGKNSQITHELLIFPNEIPYNLLINKLLFRKTLETHQISFYLPLNPFKFCKIEFFSNVKFRKIWKEFPKDQKIESGDITLDQNIDINEFLNSFFELNYRSKGNLFKFKDNLIYVKIRKHSKNICFSIYCKEINLSNFLINWLILIFSKN